jgi:SAM-dependent methyltransferase
MASDTVLEIGAGAGHFARSVTCKTYTGLETNPAAVATAEVAGQLVLDQTVAQYLAATGDPLDVVCLFQVLEHVHDPVRFLRPLVDRLGVNGRLIVAVPADDSYIGHLANCPGNLPPHHLSRWSDKSLCRLGEVLKLTLIESVHEGVTEVPSQVQATKIRDCAMVTLMDALDAVLHREPKPVRRSWGDQILLKIARAGAAPLAKCLQARPMGIWGHTVAAVFRR